MPLPRIMHPGSWFSGEGLYEAQGKAHAACVLKTMANVLSTINNQFCHGENHFLEVKNWCWDVAGSPLCYFICWEFPILCSVFSNSSPKGCGGAMLPAGPCSMWLTWVGIVSGDQVWTFLGERRVGIGAIMGVQGDLNKLFLPQSI